MVVLEYLHDSRMVKFPADFCSRLKRSKSTDQTPFPDGEFYRHSAIVPGVRSLVNRRHAAARHKVFDAIVIEQISCVNGSHQMIWSTKELSQFVRTSAIHAHPLDFANPDQLYADIISAVPIVARATSLRAAVSRAGFQEIASAIWLPETGREGRRSKGPARHRREPDGR